MKLPINPLLYLVSLASLAGIVHSVYKFSDTSLAYNAPAREAIKKKNEELKKQSTSLTTNQERWNYAEPSFWTQLKEVNLTGKVAVVQVPEAPETAVEPKGPKPEIIDLTEVLEVICISRAGNDTGVVVHYNTNVTVPPKEVVTLSAPVRDTVPKGRRTDNIPQVAPASSLASTPPDHIGLGESLWKPYDYVYLKAVADDASHVVFELRIEEKKDPEKGYPIQRMIKGSLDLPKDVVDKVIQARGGDAAAVAANGAGEAGDAGSESDWVDTPKTVISSGGKVNVSELDGRFLETNAQDIFTDDVHMADYSGSTGGSRIRGVQIRKLSSRVQQFGMAVGDVVISINNIPVTGMANAKIVGRRLYNKGVRSFKAEILRQGQIITRTFTFKK